MRLIHAGPVFLLLCVTGFAAAKRKVIIDQDAFGPGGPNLRT